MTRARKTTKRTLALLAVMTVTGCAATASADKPRDSHSEHAVPQIAGLNAVSCMSSDNVWALGGGFFHWNGSQWIAAPAKLPRNGGASSLAMASRTLGWAVGYSESNTGRESPLIVGWDGKRWSVVPHPSTGDSSLGGVTVTASGRAWAVGIGDGALIEHWNGSAWRVADAPNGGSSAILSGVDALTPRDVWAVGSRHGGETFIEHWDGTSWSVVPSPSPGGDKPLDFLVSVRAVSSNDVWAVGTRYGGSTGVLGSGLIERWNGHRWSVVDSAQPNQSGVRLTGVAATSSDDAWAVGYTAANGSGDRTFIEHWDGSASTRQRSPQLPVWPTLEGACAQSASDAWAVGSRLASDGVTDKAVIDHWDGQDWRSD